MPRRISRIAAAQARKLVLQGKTYKEAASLLKCGPASISRRNEKAVEYGFDTLAVCEQVIEAEEQALPLPGVDVERPAAESDLGGDELLRLRARVKDLTHQVKAMRKVALTDATVKSFITGVKADDSSFPAWVPTSKPLSNENDVDVPMLLVSDLHWAEVVSPDEIMGLNEYNLDIAGQRLRALADNTEYLFFKHLRPRNWPGIVVNLAGDMLSGEIHPELTETNEKYLMPAFLDLRRNLGAFLVRLADLFGCVFVPCAWGNHSRTTKKVPMKRAAHRNFDWLLYHELADMLQDDERITFAIAEGVELRYTVAGHRYNLTHGHNFRGGQGFVGPMAPITRGELKKRLASLSQNLPYDTLLMGHYHQTMWRKHVIVNGSLIGYNEMAIACDFPFDQPKQLAWLTSGRYGPTNMMEVYCTEVPLPDELKAEHTTISWKGVG